MKRQAVKKLTIHDFFFLLYKKQHCKRISEIKMPSVKFGNKKLKNICIGKKILTEEGLNNSLLMDTIRTFSSITGGDIIVDEDNLVEIVQDLLGKVENIEEILDPEKASSNFIVDGGDVEFIV